MKCPSCDTEIILVDGKPPKTCANCKVNLGQFSDFETLMDAYIGKKKRTHPEKEEKDEGFFDILGKI